MCPNAALLRDKVMRVAGNKLTTAIWTSRCGELQDVQVIFTALESMTAKVFHLQLDKCKRRVNRLVYDEIHGLLSEVDYRRDFIKLEKLAVVPIQKIYLSATIPIYLLQRLWNMLAAPPTTRTICAPFVQRNLRIHRVTLHPNDDRATFLELLLPHLAQQYMGDQRQGIVFLNAKQDVDDIHAHCISHGIDRSPLIRQLRLAGERRGIVDGWRCALDYRYGNPHSRNRQCQLCRGHRCRLGSWSYSPRTGVGPCRAERAARIRFFDCIPPTPLSV
ncbi:hypothetical protein DFH08DRAFT_423083 [Mycena albidolilacea]|uniref:Helicase ATP-binding domain-containing protein n=1 Tax=Mycena albidolilacea TaxID=1033008 RepID=A0AAD7EF33_9AGAR|nr:hypothetical protein DFH08DRAFT_423083 [Mycena albidolilacea]